jgi:hypothetical protein
MNEPALTEAVKTDLPSPKPNRRRRPYGRPSLGRLALRFAVLVVAVSALGVACSFTRPPELVWWRSPQIYSTGRRIRVLVPNGWSLHDSYPDGDTMTHYNIKPHERARPRWLEWFGLLQEEDSNLEVLVACYKDALEDRSVHAESIVAWPLGESSSSRELTSSDGHIWVQVTYLRQASAFERTHVAICNSLTIE